jgi:hypothetical protein
LKQSQTAYDGPDPLETLDKVLGTTSKDELHATSIGVEDLELDVDFGGLGLRDFAAQPVAEAVADSSAQRQTVDECRSHPYQHRGISR